MKDESEIVGAFGLRFNGEYSGWGREGEGDKGKVVYKTDVIHGILLDFHDSHARGRQAIVHHQSPLNDKKTMDFREFGGRSASRLVRLLSCGG